MDAALDAWFVAEVLVHEGALTRYLRRTWFEADDILDLRQETYVRVYEAAARARPLNPKSFLFTTARHLMTDRLRRRRVVAIDAVGDLQDSFVLIDERSPERCLDGREALRRLTQAFEALPPRCREVVWLRRVEELPQRQVAAQMGISEKTVEKQLAKGMRFIADCYFGGADRADVLPVRRRAQRNNHGQRRD